MNSKHAFLALSVFTLVSIAHGEREVFAPTKLAPTAIGTNLDLTGGNSAAPSSTASTEPLTVGGYTGVGNIAAGVYGATRGILLLGANPAAVTQGIGTIKMLYGARSTTDENVASIVALQGTSTTNDSTSGGSFTIDTRPTGGASLVRRFGIMSTGDIVAGQLDTGYTTGTPPNDTTIRSTQITGGTDVPGASLTIAAGSSTGSAAGGSLRFSTAPSGAAGATPNAVVERMRIDSAGRMLVNHTASVNVGAGAGQVQISGVDGNSALQSIVRYSADGSGPTLAFGKSRNATIGGQTAVANGDRIGLIAFAGSDGNDMDNNGGAGIQSSVDGAVSTGNVPSRLEFITTAAGGSQTERMRITSAGNVFVGNGETAASVANGNIRATGGSGTNINGADLVLHGGQSTGTASGGILRFFTASAGGVSGTSVNASTERMRITSGGEIVAGNGDTSATPAAATIRGTDGNGTNIAGADITIRGGQSTGSATGGNLILSTSGNSVSGTSLNAPVERMRVKSTGAVRFIPRTTPGSPEDGDVYYNSGTNKLQVRAAGVWVDLH